MRDLNLDDEEEGAEAPEIHLEETDAPCAECGDEGCNLYPSYTTDRDTGAPDPDIALCIGCGQAHEAFYEAVRQEEAEKEDEDEEKEAA
jgi:hypothetical protein